LDAVAAGDTTQTMRFPAPLIFAALAFAGCAPKNPAGWQGYIEGEFVYVAAPLGGQLEKLAVQRGARVAAGAPLFALERSAELSAQRQAADQLGSAQSRLEDLKKGSRPTELASLQARLDQARAAAELSKRDLERAESLLATHVIAQSDYDHAHTAQQQNTQAVDELTAQLETAQLGGRPDAIAAAAADVRAAAAAKERADWNVDQKAQAAPRAALVYDTLYREGEFVATGLPVVALLPPEYIKVRFFVPEADFAALKAGDTIHVAITDRAPLDARVTYLSPQPEYTPPVLYNRDNRAKLVFMVEAFFTDATAARDLHPGQPADVTKTSN